MLDPSDWYLTLPTGHKGDPDTVAMPKLADHSCTAFHLNDAKDGVVFTANAGGVTTSGSSYPRSELREMTGSKLASWTNTHGTHTLTVRQAVTTLPKAKPDVVTAQIHDANDDVLEVRLEGSKLIAQYNDGKTDVTLDPDYTLGTAYDLTLTAVRRADPGRLQRREEARHREAGLGLVLQVRQLRAVQHQQGRQAERRRRRRHLPARRPARRMIAPKAAARQDASRARIRRRAVLPSPTGTSRPARPSPDGGMLL